MPKEGTIERKHKNITKVNLADDYSASENTFESINELKDHDCYSKRKEVSNKTSSNSILNQEHFDLMKSTITQIVNDKESALKENIALKMYKHSVENLKKENARLMKEIRKLQEMHKVSDASDDDVRYSPDGTDDDADADSDAVKNRSSKVPTEKVCRCSKGRSHSKKETSLKYGLQSRCLY